MATVALVWELGSDFGHIGRFLPLALALRARGHEPVMILNDIARGQAMLGVHGLRFLQAPLWRHPVRGGGFDLNFTETLLRHGFLDPNGLVSLARAWRELYRLIRPDCLVFDHAPSAMLAARGLGLARIAIGNGFVIPPRHTPLPAYRWWADPAAARDRLADTESRLVRSANAALDTLGAPRLSCVADLYETEATVICGLPALDAYGARRDADYIGPVNNIDTGLDPQWPEGDGPKVFAYLKGRYAHLDPVLDALRHTPARVLVFATDVPRATVRRFESASLRFSPAPLRMRAVVEQCDAAICHGGQTTDTLLEGGRPVLLLPMHTEQWLTSLRAQQTGAALSWPHDGDPGALPGLLARLVGEAGLADQAKAFARAQRYGSIDDRVAHILSRVESLLAATPSISARVGAAASALPDRSPADR